MKISKLFHWLYAFLMLLPVFFIGGKCLYVTFNKNAKDSYYGETINEVLYNEVDNFVVGQNYSIISPSSLSYSRFSGNTQIEVENVVYDGVDKDIEYLRFYVNEGQDYLTIQSIGGTDSIFFNTTSNHQCDFTYISRNNDTYLSDIFTITFKITYNKYSYLDNAFIYSVNSLNDVPLFSWAKTSFLAAPFSYISGLFGIESTSPINTMLSYWLAISIIWLVFDLIMYVPLLVHRWIDKAKLE